MNDAARTVPLTMVVFDLDDTLYPEVQFVRGGIMAAGARLDGILGRRTNAGEVFGDMLRRYGVAKVFDRGLDALGIDVDSGFVGELVRAFRDHEPSLTPYPGIPELLHGLVEHGVRLGLISDGPAQVQRNKWSALGLDVPFEVVLFTDELGGRDTWKPDPAAFVEVQRRTGLSGMALAMVGDRPEKDFPAADALGWRTLRVRHAGSYHAADPDTRDGRPEARDVTQMEKVLLGWLAGFD
ncbi:MAG: HAD hydrolase-like protein [Deltaproteobacteria bacterium]|nr:HAD hydrolase-like protein [Deltaproteobacteria bacterium]